MMLQASTSFGISGLPAPVRLAKRMAWTCGMDFSRLPPMESRIRAYGTPDCLVDVGVGQGSPALYAAHPSIPLVMVDADPAQKQQFYAIAGQERRRRVSVSAYSAAAWDQSGELGFTPGAYCEQGKCESGGGVTVPCIKLDDIVPTGARAGVKIDVEGQELRVLRGAERVLADALWVICEVWLHGDNYTPHDLIGLLARHGLHLHDIISGIGTSAKPVGSIDMVFSRGGE